MLKSVKKETYVQAQQSAAQQFAATADAPKAAEPKARSISLPLLHDFEQRFYRIARFFKSFFLPKSPFSIDHTSGRNQDVDQDTIKFPSSVFFDKVSKLRFQRGSNRISRCCIVGWTLRNLYLSLDASSSSKRHRRSRSSLKIRMRAASRPRTLSSWCRRCSQRLSVPVRINRSINQTRLKLSVHLYEKLGCVKREHVRENEK